MPDPRTTAPPMIRVGHIDLSFHDAAARIRALEDPKGLLGGVDNATLIVRKDALTRLGEDTLVELAALHLGNARVSALDDALRTRRTPTDDVSEDRS